MQAELPFDLIESNILPRLPAKSVGRCMCVCKRWKSVLSTPAFARMHLHHVTINDYKLFRLDAPITIPDPGAEFVLASLDGLLCLALPPRETTSSDCELAFWNPLTGAYKKLSSSVCFGFDMITSEGAIALYVDSCNDYKLLCMPFGGLLGAFIYSNRLDSWRRLEVPLRLFDGRPRWSPATFWRDCLYFVVRDNHRPSPRRIICFDVKKESFRKIASPLDLCYATLSLCGVSLAVLGRALHLCVSSDTSGYLWRMGDDGEWVKVINTRLQQRVCTTNSSEDDWVAVLEENKDCVEKMKTEEFLRDYWNFSCSSWRYMSSRMMYVETLVSPNP